MQPNPRLTANSSIMHTLVGLLGVLAGVMAPTSVCALSCADPLETLPTPDSEAPRNARVWIYIPPQQPATFRWIDEGNGELVSFTVKRIPVAGADLTVLIPVAPLAFPASYRVEQCNPDPRWPCFPLTQFKTTSETDEQAPALPLVRKAGEHAEQDEWGVWRTVSFEVDGDAIVVADVEGAAGQSPLADGAKIGAITSDEFIAIGKSPCTPETFPGERGNVRFGTLDIAGNFSGFSEPMTVEKPSLEEEGCSLATDGPGDWLMMSSAALLLCLRRRSALRISR